MEQPHAEPHLKEGTLMIRLLLLAALLLILPHVAMPAGTATPAPKASAVPEDTERLKRLERLMERIFTSPTSSRTKFDPAPNRFLAESVENLNPGKALDVGIGQGRNALYLARRGWDVTGFDMSPTGIAQTLEAARKEHLPIHAVVASDRDFPFGVEQWDLIVLSYVDFRSFADRVRKSLKPGGVVVAEYYHHDTGKYRPMSDAKGFRDNELLRLFSDFRVLRYEDVAARPDWNFDGNERHRVVRLLARKKDPKEPVACYDRGKTFGAGEETCRDGKKMKCGESGWQARGRCK